MYVLYFAYDALDNIFFVLRIWMHVSNHYAWPRENSILQLSRSMPVSILAFLRLDYH